MAFNFLCSCPLGLTANLNFNISKSLYLVPYVQDVVTIIGLAYYQNSRGL